MTLAFIHKVTLGKKMMKIDEILVSLLTLLDLIAAFDTLDHTLLLDRLSLTFGILAFALQWSTSYLNCTPHTVCDKRCIPNPTTVRSQSQLSKFYRWHSATQCISATSFSISDDWFRILYRVNQSMDGQQQTQTERWQNRSFSGRLAFMLQPDQ